MKGLHSHHLDFEIIPTGNKKTIVFLDASQYFEQPESPLLQVTLPGFSKYFLVNIESGKINVFNSNTLGFTDVLESDCTIEFPDGIYTYTYKICPYQYLHLTKYHLRTSQIECAIKSIYSAIDVGECCEKDDEKIKKELVDVHILLESAKANAELGNLERGQKDYQLALKKVNKLSEKLS